MQFFPSVNKQIDMRMIKQHSNINEPQFIQDYFRQMQLNLEISNKVKEELMTNEKYSDLSSMMKMANGDLSATMSTSPYEASKEKRHKNY